MEVNFYTIFLGIKIKLTSNFREEDEEIRRCNMQRASQHKKENS